jgi:hypothetical protein
MNGPSGEIFKERHPVPLVRTGTSSPRLPVGNLTHFIRAAVTVYGDAFQTSSDKDLFRSALRQKHLTGLTTPLLQRLPA